MYFLDPGIRFEVCLGISSRIRKSENLYTVRILLTLIWLGIVENQGLGADQPDRITCYRLEETFAFLERLTVPWFYKYVDCCIQLCGCPLSGMYVKNLMWNQLQSLKGSLILPVIGKCNDV